MPPRSGESTVALCKDEEPGKSTELHTAPLSSLPCRQRYVGASTGQPSPAHMTVSYVENGEQVNAVKRPPHRALSPRLMAQT